MKKKLLTAAILSASCLFASAYTLETAVGYWGEGGVVSGLTKAENTSGGFTLTATGEAFTATSGSGIREDITIAVTFDCDEIDFSGNADMCLFYFDGNGRYDLGIGWDASENKFTATWGTNYTVAKPGISATGTVSFVFTMGDNGARFYLPDGTTFWTSSNVRGDLGDPVTSIVVSSAAETAIDSLVVWNKDIAFANGASDVVSAARAAQSIVPEPSAFGLLAGLGALSLVASRRRRR